VALGWRPAAATDPLGRQGRSLFAGWCGHPDRAADLDLELAGTSVLDERLVLLDHLVADRPGDGGGTAR
jgi:hypothetical protein